MLWLVIIGWLVVGAGVAWVMNSNFDLGGPVDPGASGSRIIPKWLIIIAIVLLWPFAPLLILYALISWMTDGSH